ncbi:MAG: hypothetical protein KDK26_07975 [Roseivivax sp.]|nr:hypothetical protein [Roseivivax sp.]
MRNTRFQNRKLMVAFVLALALVVFFAVRLVRDTPFWHLPDKPPDRIEPWMTPRFISHAWDVPPDVVAQALQLEHDGTGRRVTMGELAESRGIPLEDLAAAVAQAIAAFRAGQ